MKTTINFPPSNRLTFGSLAVGDIFALEDTDKFIGIKVDKSKTKEDYNCVVLANKEGDGYAKPGSHSYVLDGSTVHLVDHATYNIK